MNPREFLREPGYPFSVLTTYSFDPFFFERLILPDLWAGGSSSVMVFVDGGELDRTLDGFVGKLRHLGRRYFLVPVALRGSFHPKVFVRLGEDNALAWIGTGNLTRAGWGGNSELASAWRIGAEHQDRGAWLSGLLETLSKAAPSGLANDLILRIRGLDWLPSPGSTADGQVIVTGEGASLGRLLEERWRGRGFETLRVLTGSTDRDGAMLRWAADHFGVRTARVAASAERLSFDAAVIEELPLDISFLEAPQEKPNHAKFYWFEGPEGAAAVCGSANCSRAAWLLPGYNTEAVIVYDDADPLEFAELISLFDSGGIPSREFLPEDSAVPQEDDPEDPRVGVRSAQWDASSGLLSIHLRSSVQDGAIGELVIRDRTLELEGSGSEWFARDHTTLVDREAPLGRLVFQLPDGTLLQSGVLWVEHQNELREVLAGRDFRGTLADLRYFTSKAADYRLAHELGRIGMELLEDTAAYPDRLAPRSQRGKGDRPSTSPPVDPQALLVSLGDLSTPKGHGLGPGGSVGGISGIFRAIFSYLEGDDETEQLLEEEDEDGGGRGEAPERPVPQPPDVDHQDADDRARRILRKHMEEFFDKFEGDEFRQRCSATQMVQSGCYPIAVAMMGRQRKWCSDSDRDAWIERAIRGLVQRDRFHHVEPILDVVRARLEEDDRLGEYEHAVGDGQLWLTLLVAIDMLPVTDARGALRKLVLYRALVTRGDLVATTDHPRMAYLFRYFHDQDAIQGARARAAGATELMIALERELITHSDELLALQSAAKVGHRKGDLVWNRANAWGIVTQAESGDKVEVYIAQSGDVRLFVSEGWLVNVSQLPNLDGVDPELADATSRLGELLR